MLIVSFQDNNICSKSKDGNSYYRPGQDNTTYQNKGPSAINIDVKNTYNVDDTITIRLIPVNSTGIVHVTINGKNYIPDKSNKVTINQAVYGDYQILAILEGDDTYYGSNNTASFKVNKITPDITFTDFEIVVGMNAIINVTGPNSRNANTIISIDGTNYAVDMINGKASVTVKGLNIGKYPVTIKYLENDKYLEKTIGGQVTVKEKTKENTTIDMDAFVDESIVSITVRVNEYATGLVKLQITNKETSVEQTVYMDVKNGVATSDYLFDKGNYTITATYMGDDLFNSNTTSQDIEVIGHVMKNTPITAQADVNGYKVTITVNVAADATGFVKIKFDDTIAYIALENGTGEFTATFPSGSYNIAVTYLGDENYTTNTTQLGFTVVDPIKENTTINLDVNVVENNVTFSVDLDKNATGLVKFEITGDKEYVVYAEIENGQVVLEEIFNTGNYAITVTYMGDSRFNTNITSREFTVVGHIKKNNTITSDLFIDENYLNLTVNVDPTATGFVEFNFTGDEDFTLYISVENGKANLEIGLYEGNYTVYLTYLGDDDFNSNSTTETFTITGHVKNDTTITPNVVIDENHLILTVNVDPAATGFVEFNLTSKDWNNIAYIDFKDGKAILNVGLTNGNYTAQLTYLGDYNFNMNSTSVSFTIVGHIKNDTIITTDVVVIDSNVTISGNVNPNATGYVDFDMGDYIVSVPIKDGKFVWNTDFQPGTYDLKATYTGDYDFNENTTTVSFTVKMPTKITATQVTTTYATSKNIVVTLKDENNNAVEGKNVSVVLNGVTYTNITNASGQVSVAIPTKLAPKTYVASLTFDGDDNYVNSTGSVKVVVNKATPKLTAKKKTFKVGVKTKKYTFILKTDKNKVMKKALITLKVNKKTYKVRTNAKGRAIFKITNLNKKGTYTAVVKYAGNTYYKAKTVKPKIIVK